MKRIFPDRPILAVGALIIKKNNLLLVKRKNPPDKGQWSIPGGAVKTGESLLEAIKREITEECGITVEDGKIVAVIDKIYFTKENKVIFHYSIVDFLFKKFSERIRAGSDAEAAEFFPMDNIEKISNIAESVKDIVRTFKNNKNIPIIYTTYKEKLM